MFFDINAVNKLSSPDQKLLGKFLLERNIDALKDFNNKHHIFLSGDLHPEIEDLFA